jgi:hypothetical protein
MPPHKYAAQWTDQILLRCPYHICLCRSKEQFYYELKRLKFRPQIWQDWEYGASAAVHFYKKRNGNLYAFVCIKDKGKEVDPNDIVGALTHEAVHIWQHILVFFGEDAPGQEIESYCIESLTKKLLRAYSELAAKEKGK